MKRVSFFNSWRKGKGHSPRASKNKRFSYDNLEPRQLLATLSVTTVDDTINPNDGVLSLREAVNIANSNGEQDVIHLGAGEYILTREGVNEQANQTGDIDILADGGNRLEIIGSGFATTTVSGLNDRVFEVHHGSSFGLEQLAVTNGVLSMYTPLQGRRGGGIAAYGVNGLTLDQVKVSANNINSPNSSVAGGLYISDSTFTIADSEFTNNGASRAGQGIFVKNSTGTIVQSNLHNHLIPGNYLFNGVATLHAVDSDVEFNRSKLDLNRHGVKVEGGTFSMDHSRILSRFGSGIVSDSATINIDDSRIVRNSKGVSTTGFISRVNISNSVFISNRTAIESDGTRLNIDNTNFQSNNESIVGRGAKRDFNYQANLTNLVFDNQRNFLINISAELGTVQAENISHINTQSSLHDGGTAIRVVADTGTFRDINVLGRNTGQGMTLIAKTKFSVVDVTLDRTAGLYLAGNVDVHNATIIDGLGSGNFPGSAIYWETTDDNQTLNIVNSLLARNRSRAYATGYAGGAALFVYSHHQGGKANVLSSTVVSNKAVGGGVFHHFGQGIVGLAIHNSIVWNNTTPGLQMIGGNLILTATHNIVSGMDPAEFDPNQGNFSSNPIFVNFQSGDYRLRHTSPAIDAGDSTHLIADIYDVDSDSDTSEYVPDLDALDRVFDSETDIGAFEFMPS